MAKIGDIEMTDEQFMLITELGRILHDENYDDGGSKEFDPTKVKSERGKKIIARLEQIAEEANKANAK